MILLDTNIVSELMRAQPDAGVIKWLGSQPTASLFTTAITQAEILYGVELVPQGKRREAMLEAARAIFDEDFARRVLPFDGDASRAYAQIAAHRRLAGQPISQFDAQIAAIARSRGAVLATRNTRDFGDCNLTIVDPWTAL